MKTFLMLRCTVVVQIHRATKNINVNRIDVYKLLLINNSIRVEILKFLAVKVDVSGTECESINSSLNIPSKVANELVVKLDFAFSFQLARS